MFRYLLRLGDNEPVDPSAFVVAVPTWHVGDTFQHSNGQEYRILAIDAEHDERLTAESGPSSRFSLALPGFRPHRDHTTTAPSGTYGVGGSHG